MYACQKRLQRLQPLQQKTESTVIDFLIELTSTWDQQTALSVFTLISRTVRLADPY
jgi:hypothetical protein